MIRRGTPARDEALEQRPRDVGVALARGVERDVVAGGDLGDPVGIERVGDHDRSPAGRRRRARSSDRTTAVTSWPRVEGLGESARALAAVGAEHDDAHGRREHQPSAVRGPRRLGCAARCASSNTNPARSWPAGRDPRLAARLRHDGRGGAADRRGDRRPVVIKSQVLTGGRMKAGGVKFADTPEEAERARRARSSTSRSTATCRAACWSTRAWPSSRSTTPASSGTARASSR